MNYLNKVRSIIRGQMYFESGHGRPYEKTVLLCGSGRSGTTWLAEIINNDNLFRYMFEPFHPELVSIVRHFKSRLYLRAFNTNKDYLLPASRIFSGNVRNLWVDRYNKKIRPERRLIKDIRINLLLRWVRTNFPEMPIVFMMRHPFSVACSRIRLGWNDHLNDLYAQKELKEDFLNSFKTNYLRNNMSRFERQILMWCIENYVPISSCKSDEMYILFYEDCFSNPVQEIHGLFDYLNLPISKNILEKMKKPSQMTKKSSPLVSGEDPLLHWKKIVSHDERSKALNIMEAFGLNEIYSDGPLPNQEGLNKFLKK